MESLKHLKEGSEVIETRWGLYPRIKSVGGIYDFSKNSMWQFYKFMKKDKQIEKIKQKKD